MGMEYYGTADNYDANLLLKTSKLLISISLFNLVVQLIRRPPFFMFNPRICHHIFFYEFLFSPSMLLYFSRAKGGRVESLLAWFFSVLSLGKIQH